MAKLSSYQRLKEKNRKLKKRVKKLRKLIESGGFVAFKNC